MTQETISRFEVDGIQYVHPFYRKDYDDRADSFFNVIPMFELLSQDNGSEMKWYGPPTTKGLMDD